MNTVPFREQITDAYNPNLYECIDGVIKKEIEKLTQENHLIWTSPEYNRKEYVHRLFQYPAMMVPIVQKRVIDIIVQAAPNSKRVIDPFMGSATSLVACMENGLDCYGQDINPLSILIAKTRTGPYFLDAIRRKHNALIGEIESDESEVVEANFKGLSKWFKEPVSKELSKIVRAIRKERSAVIRRYYWINLAEVTRITSNDRTSTFKLHSRTLEEIESRNPSPIKEFKTRLTQSIEDFASYRQLLKSSNQLSKSAYKGELKFSLQDSSIKIHTSGGKREFFDLLVSSPPYGDNKTTVTYGEYSYLPLQWIDLKDIDKGVNQDYLKSTVEIDSRALGGRVKKLNESDLNLLYKRSNTFKKVHQKLKETAPDRADKVLVFLKDLNQVIERVFDVMKINSYQVWTIGNRTVGGVEIPNGEILREFIEFKQGMLVASVKREILNKRMAKRNSSSVLMNYEDILIFRKIG